MQREKRAKNGDSQTFSSKFYIASGYDGRPNTQQEQVYGIFKNAIVMNTRQR